MVGHTVHTKRMKALRSMLGREVTITLNSQSFYAGTLEYHTDRHPQGFYVDDRQLLCRRVIPCPEDNIIRLESANALRGFR